MERSQGRGKLSKRGQNAVVSHILVQKSARGPITSWRSTRVRRSREKVEHKRVKAKETHYTDSVAVGGNMHEVRSTPKTAARLTLHPARVYETFIPKCQTKVSEFVHTRCLGT